MSRRFLAALLGVGLIFSAQDFSVEAQQSPRRSLNERAVVVEAHAFSGFSVFDSAKRQFGKLTFLGGLELRASDPEFGGMSSALIDADGKGFVAISDHAHWISGRFTAEGDVLKGVEQVRIAPMIAPNGRRMKDTRWFDSESLTRTGRHYYVGVERTHDIFRFDAVNGRPTGRGTPIEVPQAVKGLNHNQGIESLGVMPKPSASAGALIAIAEHAPKSAANDNIPGWLIGGPAPGSFTVKRIGNFDITDLGFLPGGDLLILERRFTPFFGLGFRIRRIALAQVKPGAVLDGEVLIEADLSQQIDNMEALMIHRGENGKIILTLMSDDNFSLLQRNLVLRFAMDE